MDYLKELSLKIGGKIRTQNLSNWNLNGTSFRELLVKDYKGYKIGIDEYEKLFAIGIRVESDFSFSINNPDKIFNYNKTIILNDFPYKIYISDDDDDPVPSEDIDFKRFLDPFIKMIKELKLSENEGTFFYCNVIYLALSYDRDLIPILDYTIELIKSNPLIFEKNSRERIFKRIYPKILGP